MKKKKINFDLQKKTPSLSLSLSVFFSLFYFFQMLIIIQKIQYTRVVAEEEKKKKKEEEKSHVRTYLCKKITMAINEEIYYTCKFQFSLVNYFFENVVNKKKSKRICHFLLQIEAFEGGEFGGGL